jgi:hypothetical protein
MDVINIGDLDIDASMFCGNRPAKSGGDDAPMVPSTVHITY